MKNIRTVAIAAVFAVTVAASAVIAAIAASYPGQQYERHASIAVAQARSTVMRLIPNGTIVAQELEREDGGSGWRYSFDIKTAHGTREVGIDAKTGKVLENSIEPAASENGAESDGG